MTDIVMLWRCTKCAKWSHAMKKPSTHKRGIVTNDGSPYGPDIAMVPCGPFERWVAFKATGDAKVPTQAQVREVIRGG